LGNLIGTTTRLRTVNPAVFSDMGSLSLHNPGTIGRNGRIVVGVRFTHTRQGEREWRRLEGRGREESQHRAAMTGVMKAR
jgi:hypothetical protein